MLVVGMVCRKSGNESVCTCTPTQPDKKFTGDFKRKVNRDKLTNGQEAKAVIGNLLDVGAQRGVWDLGGCGVKFL